MTRDARHVWGAICTAAGIASLLVGVFILMLEIVGWLKYAHWNPIELRDLFSYLSLDEPYFSEWLGAHRLWMIFRRMPLSFLAIIVGLGLSTVIGLTNRGSDDGSALSRDPRNRFRR